jgi:DNA helicase-2/ATP-dependent DNA helicase PcrA
MLEEERRLFYVGITRAERKLFLTHAEERRRNGEFMQSKASSFLQAIPESMLEQFKTIKVRSSGRSFMQSLGGGSQWGNSRARGVDHPAREIWTDAESAFPPSASQRRPGLPVTRVAAFAEAEESQDAAVIAVGSRVKHRKFGSGVIAELAGAGRDLKAKIDFDDEAIGRKTLVVAQANLERDID